MELALGGAAAVCAGFFSNPLEVVSFKKISLFLKVEQILIIR
jgi:hypothetical protein